MNSIVTSLVRAPSNIALIKYMGKKDLPGNIPENGSLSVTLDSLCTYAEITRIPARVESSRWLAELPKIPSEHLRGEPLVPHLNEKAAERALRHVSYVRNEALTVLSRFGIAQSLEPSTWELRSANTFPAASGIASSASSFAAITVATAMALAANPLEFDKVWKRENGLRRALARLARAGSGSSCRSLQGPWVLWENQDAQPLDASKLPELAHFVLLVSEQAKAVSSSEAHQRVKTSPLWDGRVQRVQEKIRETRQALECGAIDVIARIAWREAWEMHSLFHTSAEPFSYWTQDTVALLQWLSPFVAGKNPPIVTLDAGPNIHVLVRSSEVSSWEERFQRNFPTMRFLRDSPGGGASPIMERT